jgi:hypothetical protein
MQSGAGRIQDHEIRRERLLQRFLDGFGDHSAPLWEPRASDSGRVPVDLDGHDAHARLGELAGEVARAGVGVHDRSRMTGSGNRENVRAKRMRNARIDLNE